jgi:hypothetical protein
MSSRSVHATPAEAERALPGDAFISEPMASLTYAITIGCPPDLLWPWLAQMGAGRAGWYSYDFVDNGGRSSAVEILPRLQHVEIGDVFPWLPGATEGFVVLDVAVARHLVLGSRSSTGEPVVTWAFVLEPSGDGGTRLIVRARGSHAYDFHGLPTWVACRVVPPGHFVMQRKQLLGIAERAERAAGVRRRLRIRVLPEVALAGVGALAAGYASIAALAWLRYGSADGRSAAADPVLDEFMPAYEIVERHQVRVRAPAAVTFEAAKDQDLRGSGLASAIFKARELVLGARSSDRADDRALLPAMLSLGWGILREEPGREIVLGAVTRPWQANVVFRPVPAAEFAGFDEPDYVKIVWTLRADPVGENESIFRTETRAIATDAAARAKFRRYWAWVSPGVALIRRMMLAPLKAEAERRAGGEVALAGS